MAINQAFIQQDDIPPPFMLDDTRNLNYLRAFVAQSQKNGLTEAMCTERQLFTSLKVRALYKMSRLKGHQRDVVLGACRTPGRILAFILFIL